jgi:hypothetical protein
MMVPVRNVTGLTEFFGGERFCDCIAARHIVNGFFDPPDVFGVHYGWLRTIDVCEARNAHFCAEPSRVD